MPTNFVLQTKKSSETPLLASRLGLPVSPLCDRTDFKLGKSQAALDVLSRRAKWRSGTKPLFVKLSVFFGWFWWCLVICLNKPVPFWGWQGGQATLRYSILKVFLGVHQGAVVVFTHSPCFAGDSLSGTRVIRSWWRLFGWGLKPPNPVWFFFGMSVVVLRKGFGF